MEGSERALAGSGDRRVQEGDASEVVITKVAWRFGTINLNELVPGWFRTDDLVTKIEVERMDNDTLVVLAYFGKWRPQVAKPFIIHGEWSIEMAPEEA